MDKKETDKIFDLLEQFYPNAKQVKSEKTKVAWSLALKNFTYEDVKNCAIDYAIEGQYFPNLTDITLKLKPETTTKIVFADKYGTLKEKVEKLNSLRAYMKSKGVQLNDY